MTQTGFLREIFVVIVVIIAATVFGLGLGFVDRDIVAADRDPNGLAVKDQRKKR